MSIPFRPENPFCIFQIVDTYSDGLLAEHGYVRMDYLKRPAPPAKHQEAIVAAEWWSQFLNRPPVMDNGDRTQSVFSTYVAMSLHAPARPEQIEQFKGWLAWLIDNVACNNDGWDPKDPIRASACEGRHIYCDYGPDRLLGMACRMAGIHDFDMKFPFKTGMRINPGSVTVREGYSGEKVNLMDKQKAPPVGE